MYTLLHNPRCSKSRQAKDILDQLGISYELRLYLENPLSLDELQKLQQLLGKSAMEFTRIKEADLKTSGLTKHSSDEDILSAMTQYPKLIERPILYDDTSAVIGRPPENIKVFLKA